MLDVTAGRRRGLLWFSLLGGLVALFAGYYRMALTVPTTADGAGNALQAFDLIHRNPLLHGWTVSDVSFYGVELFQFAAIERVIGLSPRVAPASAALSYALIVLLVGLLARGRATGTVAWLRIGLAVSIVLVPAPGVGQAVLLGGPDQLHLLGLGLVVIAVARTVQLAWRGIGDRVDQLIVAGIMTNLAAFAWSALNINLLASHEIVPVLPLSAVLVARVLIPSEDNRRPGWPAGWQPGPGSWRSGWPACWWSASSGTPAGRPSDRPEWP